MTEKATELPILWVDDDVFFMQKLVGHVGDAGFDVLTAEGPDEALETLESLDGKASLAVLDVMMPHGTAFSSLETMGGHRTGLELARRIRKRWPHIPIVAFSVVADAETMEWFQTQGDGYLVKPARLSQVMKTIRTATGKPDADEARGPISFIVHGHDDKLVLELKDYLQNVLGFPKPIVLRDEPSQGRTIIEKFEELSDDIDLVFALFTPDDRIVADTASASELRRARQNVVFELGFFYAKLQRRSGRVLLLHKDTLELPSDIAGVVYVDVSNGIASAGEKIRTELATWLQ